MLLNDLEIIKKCKFDLTKKKIYIIRANSSWENFVNEFKNYLHIKDNALYLRQEISLKPKYLTIFLRAIHYRYYHHHKQLILKKFKKLGRKNKRRNTTFPVMEIVIPLHHLLIDAEEYSECTSKLYLIKIITKSQLYCFQKLSGRGTFKDRSYRIINSYQSKTWHFEM